MPPRLVGLVATLALVALAPANRTVAAETAAAEAPTPTADWIPLFDGTSLDAWRGYKRDNVPPDWAIEGDVLKFNGSGGRERDKNLMTREKFGAFDLRLEWKIEAKGNSGIMYLVSETHRRPYQSGPEYQLADLGGRKPQHSSAAMYGMFSVTHKQNPNGQWNTTRIRHVDGHITHWLNGKKVVDTQVGSDDWNARAAKSPFGKDPIFARNPEGHIALQDHGTPVWFRNIRIQRLD